MTRSKYGSILKVPITADHVESLHRKLLSDIPEKDRETVCNLLVERDSFLASEARKTIRRRLKRSDQHTFGNGKSPEDAFPNWRAKMWACFASVPCIVKTNPVGYSRIIAETACKDLLRAAFPTVELQDQQFSKRYDAVITACIKKQLLVRSEDQSSVALASKDIKVGKDAAQVATDLNSIGAIRVIPADFDTVNSLAKLILRIVGSADGFVSLQGIKNAVRALRESVRPPSTERTAFIEELAMSGTEIAVANGEADAILDRILFEQALSSKFLHPHDRELIELLADGHSQAQLAKAQGLNASTFRTHILKIRTRFRSFFEIDDGCREAGK